jgi:hypothetical protein
MQVSCAESKRKQPAIVRLFSRERTVVIFETIIFDETESAIRLKSDGGEARNIQVLFGAEEIEQRKAQ